jgi:hypothetical protein
MGRAEGLFQCPIGFNTGGCAGNSASRHVSSGEGRLSISYVIQSAFSNPSGNGNVSRRRHSFAIWRIKREVRHTQSVSSSSLSFYVRSPADFISTFFHKDRVWPMRDNASPFEGWDYYEYIRFAPKATNNVMGSLFFFLRDALLRFYKRIKDIDIHFRLFNVDARELPDHLSTEESQFDRIEVGYKFSLDLTSKYIMTVNTNIGLKHL